MRVRAVLDANVLFAAAIRDTLFRAASEDLYQMYFTRQILEELERNLIRTGRANAEQAARLNAAITGAFATSIVPDSYVVKIPEMPVNAKDQHVVSAAVHTESQVIVTQNLKDFPNKALSPLRITALDADRFLSQLFSLSPTMMCRIVIEQASDLQKPPIRVDEVLEFISELAPEFAGRVRETIHENL